MEQIPHLNFLRMLKTWNSMDQVGFITEFASMTIDLYKDITEGDSSYNELPIQDLSVPNIQNKTIFCVYVSV